MNVQRRRYAASVLSPAAAAGAALASILAGSKNSILVREVHVSLTAATSTSVGLLRGLTAGTQTTPTTPEKADSGDPAAQALVANAWSVAPTISGTPVYLRRHVLPATIGAEKIFTFDQEKPLILKPGESLHVWNFGAGAAGICTVTFVIDELYP